MVSCRACKFESFPDCTNWRSKTIPNDSIPNCRLPAIEYGSFLELPAYSKRNNRSATNCNGSCKCYFNCNSLQTSALRTKSIKLLGGATWLRSKGLMKQRQFVASTIAVKFYNCKYNLQLQRQKISYNNSVGNLSKIVNERARMINAQLGNFNFFVFVLFVDFNLLLQLQMFFTFVNVIGSASTVEHVLKSYCNVKKIKNYKETNKLQRTLFLMYLHNKIAPKTAAVKSHKINKNAHKCVNTRRRRYISIKIKL